MTEQTSRLKSLKNALDGCPNVYVNGERVADYGGRLLVALFVVDDTLPDGIDAEISRARAEGIAMAFSGLPREERDRVYAKARRGELTL